MHYYYAGTQPRCPRACIVIIILEHTFLLSSIKSPLHLGLRVRTYPETLSIVRGSS